MSSDRGVFTSSGTVSADDQAQSIFAVRDEVVQAALAKPPLANLDDAELRQVRGLLARALRSD